MVRLVPTGKIVSSLILALLLVSCDRGPKRAPAIGEAFVGPAILKIRSDIPLQSPVVTTVKHGDHLLLLQRRRRFFRVRTPSGVEGWTDERQLLAAEDMHKLKDLAVRASRMPPQGQATTFGELNVHTQPSRQSPSFLQVKENEKVDVLTHSAAPRTEGARKPLLPPAAKKAKAVEKKPAKETKYPPLSVPKPPGPPANWLDLSKTDLSAEDSAADDETEKEEEPVALDDWSLVRTKGGESGWVLTRRLVMAIPDEVAQYAEGHRIVSYFPLGEVQDEDQKKRNWLWTTIGNGVYPYDFDSFRIFIWSLRRHRYETAYIERNLHGYSPVLLKEVELSSARGSSASSAKYPGFSVCVEKKDGRRYRREYAFLTNIVRLAGEQPCETQAQETLVAQTALAVGTPQEQPPPEGFTQRFRKRLRAITKGWFGG
ncbi:MAG: hypothetical protein C5B51_25860 [Terriglobia bacterium]|nr:MAG: hypothetical protein C5B51_25860 [Terriglobia bacterium]